MIRAVLAAGLLLLTACRPLGYSTLDETDIIATVVDEEFDFASLGTYALHTEVLDLDSISAKENTVHTMTPMAG